MILRSLLVTYLVGCGSRVSSSSDHLDASEDLSDSGGSAGADSGTEPPDAAVIHPDDDTRPVELVDLDSPPIGAENDEDEDGFVGEAAGGDDCDDRDPSVHPGASDGTWLVSTVDDDQSLGPNAGGIALAIDGNGAPWLFYGAYRAEWEAGVRSAIRVAQGSGGGWRRFELLTPEWDGETYCCGPVDLSFTPRGEPVMNYYAGTDLAEGFAHVLYRTGEQWFDDSPFRDHEGLAFVHASSGVGLQDRVRLAIGFEQSWGRAGWLWMGDRDRDSWEMVEVDAAFGGGPRLIVDTQNRPHVAYGHARGGVKDGIGLHYASDDDGWSAEELDVTCIDWAFDLAMDGTVPVLIFKSWDGVEAGRRENGEWILESVVSDVSVAELAATSGPNGVGVFYLRYDNVDGSPDFGRDLWFTERRDDSWQRELVILEYGWVLRATRATDGTLHVAYWTGDPGTLQLRYGVRTPDGDGIDQDCDGSDG